jgi:hypothetical protein
LLDKIVVTSNPTATFTSGSGDIEFLLPAVWSRGGIVDRDVDACNGGLEWYGVVCDGYVDVDSLPSILVGVGTREQRSRGIRYCGLGEYVGPISSRIHLIWG